MNDNLTSAWYYARGLRYSGLRVFRRDTGRTGTHVRVSLVDPFFGQPSADPLERFVLDLPFGVLDVDMMVFRGVSRDHDFIRIAQSIEERTLQKVALGILEFGDSPSGFLPPTIVQVAGKIPLEDKIALKEIRDLELRAQLAWSGAIQAPARAHFELPAGTHASGFVRVADALTETVVLERWADWIKPYLTTNSVIVGDTWTILPLLEAVGWAGAVHGKKAPVITFPGYPTLSTFEQVLISVLPLLAKEALGRVIFVISVVSTEAFLQRIKHYAPKVLGPGAEVVLLPLVDTQPEEKSIEAFVRIPGIQRFDVPKGEVCALCRDSERKPLVVIDRSRYAPVLEGSLLPQMLKSDSAALHRDFWQFASETDAVRVHVDDFSTGERRHLPISMDISRLLGHKVFRRSVLAKLALNVPLCDFVVIPNHAATKDLIKLAKTVYGREIQTFVLPRAAGDLGTGVKGDDFIEVEALLKKRMKKPYEHILILDDAIINGRTVRSIHRLLQNVLTKIRGVENRTRSYEIRAFVVVGRPSTENRWKRLTNSLRQGQQGVHLSCAELLYMPDASAPCPWCEETRFLQELLKDLLSVEVRERVQESLELSDRAVRDVLSSIRQRLWHLQPQAPAHELALGESLYLCRSNGSMAIAQAECLSPHSLFGENLSEATAYAAVSTALQELRLGRSREPGVSYVWDVPKVLTAYHDPLLSAAFLRAAFRDEIVVMSDTSEFNDALAEISFASSHTEFRQSPVLAAELEWALLTDKLPAQSTEGIRDRIDPIIRNVGPPLKTVIDVTRALRNPG